MRILTLALCVVGAALVGVAAPATAEGVGLTCTVHARVSWTFPNPPSVDDLGSQCSGELPW